LLQLATDCHPDRSRSFPKETSCAVEGPAVSRTHSNTQNL
jgi:hypothetical protein